MSGFDTDAAATATEAIVERIRPMLAGLGPEVQSAVLADLVAIWLAGYQGEDKLDLREAMLANWLETVRALVPVNEAILIDRIKPEGHT